MRFLIALFAVTFLWSSAASAGWNIKQNADGSTVWEDDAGASVPVGNGGLIVAVTNFSEAQTQYVVSHKSGTVTKVYVTGRAVDSGTSAVGVQYSSGSGLFNELTPLTVGYALSADGASNSVSISSNNFAVTQGSVLGLNIDGGATCATGCGGNIVIVIE